MATPRSDLENRFVVFAKAAIAELLAYAQTERNSGDVSHALELEILADEGRALVMEAL